MDDRFSHKCDEFPNALLTNPRLILRVSWEFIFCANSNLKFLAGFEERRRILTLLGVRCVSIYSDSSALIIGKVCLLPETLCQLTSKDARKCVHWQPLLSLCGITMTYPTVGLRRTKITGRPTSRGVRRTTPTPPIPPRRRGAHAPPLNPTIHVPVSQTKKEGAAAKSSSGKRWGASSRAVWPFFHGTPDRILRDCVLVRGGRGGVVFSLGILASSQNWWTWKIRCELSAG